MNSEDTVDVTTHNKIITAIVLRNVDFDSTIIFVVVLRMISGNSTANQILDGSCLSLLYMWSIYKMKKALIRSLASVYGKIAAF